MTTPELEYPPGTLDLFAKFHLSIGNLTKAINQANRLEQQRLATLPVNYPFSKMSSPGAATTDLQDFGGPTPGRQWVIRLLTAFASPLAANAAVVTWYVGQVVPGPAAGMLPATMARWQFASVPAFQNFTTDIIKVQVGEHLIAGLTGIPASSNIGLTAIVNDYPLFGQAAAVAVE
jgi:hypothetical protein